MNTEKRHISSAFDRDLETIQALVVRMGGMVERAIADAATALETFDDELAEDVRRRDKEIDALDAQVNEEAARLIALRAPAATISAPSVCWHKGSIRSFWCAGPTGSRNAGPTVIFCACCICRCKERRPLPEEAM